jgi:hypothetical protein
MKLRELFESKNSVAIIFGRFNPPHKGHKAAWQIASKHPHWYVGTNQSTQGPKDPLPFDVKIQAMTAIWPEVQEHIVAEQSWLTLASKVYQDHGEVTLFCLTDEDWVTKTIVQYNGKEGTHGFYNFPSIKQQATPRLSSATALRDAVIKDDREAFSHAAGVPADTEVAGHPFFDLVAHYLMPYQNAPKKVAKKKVKEPVEGMAPPSAPNFSTDGGHHTLETKRMSAQVKLQRAWDRERAKSDASRERMRRELELIAGKKPQEEPKKDVTEFARSGDDGREFMSWQEFLTIVTPTMRKWGFHAENKNPEMMYSRRGRMEDEHYFIILDPQDDMVHYSFGTVEDGEPMMHEQNFVSMDKHGAKVLLDTANEGYSLSDIAQEKR